MKQVIAKFECVEIRLHGNGSEIKLTPVIGYEGENKAFTDATPYGELTMGLSINAPADGFFKIGSKYNLTFEQSK